MKLSETENAWRQRCRTFAREVIAPRAAACDRANQFPAEVHALAHEAGLVNICLPAALGGGGASHRLLAIGGEELAAACAPTAFGLGFNHGALRPIVRYGSDEQRRRFVADTVAQGAYASICMTEAAGSGSNLAAVRTRAVRQGERWVLSGAKAMIGNGTVASVFTVLANAIVDGEDRGLTFFIVSAGERVHVGDNPDKLGFRCLPTPTVDFAGVELDEGCVLGEVGGADAMLLDSLDYMRFGGGCILLGLVAGALRDAMPWIERRTVLGGEPLGAKSHVQLLLGDIYSELLCLRRMLLAAADAIDAGEPCSVDTAVVKLRASRLAERATSDVAQLFGWRGIDNDYPIQKRMRDARVTTIYEGTSEIQMLNLFAELRRSHATTGEL